MKNNINTLLNSLSNLGEIRKAVKNIGEYSSTSDNTMTVGTVVNQRRAILNECLKSFNFNKYLKAFGICTEEDFLNLIEFVNAWNKKFSHYRICLPETLSTKDKGHEEVNYIGCYSHYFYTVASSDEDVPIRISEQWSVAFCKAINKDPSQISTSLHVKRIPCDLFDFRGANIQNGAKQYIDDFSMPFDIKLIGKTDNSVEPLFLEVSGLDRLPVNIIKNLEFNDIDNKNNLCNALPLTLALTTNTRQSFFDAFPSHLYRTSFVEDVDAVNAKINFLCDSFKAFKNFHNGLHITVENIKRANSDNHKSTSIIKFVVFNVEDVGNIATCLQNVYIDAINCDVETIICFNILELTQDPETTKYTSPASVFRGLQNWLSTNCKGISIENIQVTDCRYPTALYVPEFEESNSFAYSSNNIVYKNYFMLALGSGNNNSAIMLDSFGIATPKTSKDPNATEPIIFEVDDYDAYGFKTNVIDNGYIDYRKGTNYRNMLYGQAKAFCNQMFSIINDHNDKAFLEFIETEGMNYKEGSDGLMKKLLKKFPSFDIILFARSIYGTTFFQNGDAYIEWLKENHLAQSLLNRKKNKLLIDCLCHTIAFEMVCDICDNIASFLKSYKNMLEDEYPNDRSKTYLNFETEEIVQIIYDILKYQLIEDSKQITEKYDIKSIIS